MVNHYIWVCKIACDIFHLARMRLFHGLEELLRSGCEDHIVGLAEQALCDGGANALAGAGDDEHFGSHFEEMCNFERRN